MCRFQRIFAIAGLFIGLMINLPGYAQTPMQYSNTSVEKVSVRDILEDLGKRYDRFFTIEEISSEMGNILYRRSERLVSNKNILEELDQLSKLIPDLTYRVDKREPRIIHVSDTRVGRQKGYALDRIVSRIDFTGPVYELIKVLRNQGIRISGGGMAMGVDEWLVTDFGTKVHVRGKRLRVRNVLSDFIPLEERSSRILWIAETKPVEGETTRLRFRGTAPLRK